MNQLSAREQIAGPSKKPLPVRIVAVIVLYKETPARSASFQTLQAAMKQVPAGEPHLRIFLYDNTPGGQDIGVLPEGVVYEAAHENRGVADAYNRALEIAQAEGCDWLLTFDQDSTLPADFLSALASAIARVADDPNIAAVVPQLNHGEEMLSPNYFILGGAIPRFFPKGFTGIPTRDTYAFNSVSTLRVSALREVGGYSPWFWFDNSDSYIYRQLHLHGKKVFVAGNIQVEHDFSMLNYRQRVSVARYRNVVDTGCAFWDLELGTFAGLYHTASLAYRVYKHWRRGDDPALREIALKMLKKRIFQSRKQRIAQWKADVASSSARAKAEI